MHTQHTEIIGVFRVWRAQPFQRGNAWHPGHGDKLAQRRHCLRHANPAANVQHRFVRLRQQLSGLRQLCRRIVQFFHYRHQVRMQVTLRQLDVFRDIDQHWAWATAAGNGESFRHDARQRVQ
ncbi:hypothetical protein D3C79_930550 [compost metagenome]